MGDLPDYTKYVNANPDVPWDQVGPIKTVRYVSTPPVLADGDYGFIFSDLAGRIYTIGAGGSIDEIVGITGVVKVDHQQIKGTVLKDPTISSSVPMSIENPAIAYDVAGDKFKVDIFGSQASKILQRASTFDTLVQLRHAETEIDPRAIRALTATDVVTPAVAKGDWLSTLPITKGDWLSALPNPSNLDIAASVLRDALLAGTATYPGGLDDIYNKLNTQLDVLLSTRLKIDDFAFTKELGRVGIITAASGSPISPATETTLTAIKDTSGIKKITDAVDVSDDATREVGRVYGKSGDPLFSIEDEVSEQISNTNAATGYNSLSGSEVPAGKKYIINNICAANTTTNPSRVNLIAIVNGVYVFLVDKLSPGMDMRVTWSGQIVLGAGDKIFVAFYDCLAGDNIYMNYCGYVMDA